MQSILASRERILKKFYGAVESGTSRPTSHLDFGAHPNSRFMNPDLD